MNSFQNIEKRLIKFAADIIKFSRAINKSYAGLHLSKQIIRSATSASLNYGEAQCAESKKDFIHKMKIVTKELKETSIALEIIESLLYSEDLRKLQNENRQLLAIFLKSIKTAKSR